MARTDKAIIKRNAVFVKERKDGRDVFVRRPYDLVEYNWGDTTANATYLQPHFGRPLSAGTPNPDGGISAAGARSEVYDDIRIFATPPDWDLIGRGSDL